MGDYFYSIVLKTERKLLLVFFFLLGEVERKREIRLRVCWFIGGIFWNGTASLDVISYAIHGKEEANLLHLAYGAHLCNREGPLWCLIFTLSCVLLDALHHFVLDTVLKRMHRDLHKVPDGNISEISEQCLWYSDHLKEEGVFWRHVMSKMGISAQNKA